MIYHLTLTILIYMDKIIKGKKIKTINLKPQQYRFENQDNFNQIYINDLLKVLSTNLTLPTHIPKKFIDSFYLYFNGTSTYRLYVYINSTWKYITLS